MLLLLQLHCYTTTRTRVEMRRISLNAGSSEVLVCGLKSVETQLNAVNDRLDQIIAARPVEPLT